MTNSGAVFTDTHLQPFQWQPIVRADEACQSESVGSSSATLRLSAQLDVLTLHGGSCPGRQIQQAAHPPGGFCLCLACRLSLSWSRILPGGGRGSAPNAAALRFYTSLLQQLHAAGITPVVTLYHFDLPQVLQV